MGGLKKTWERPDKRGRMSGERLELNRGFAKNAVAALHNIHLVKRLVRLVDVGHVHSKMFYSKRLGPKLRDIIAQQTDKPNAEQLRVAEELAIIRSVTLDALQMYNAVQESEVSNQLTEKQRNEFLLTTGAIARDACQHVIKACEAAARIDQMGMNCVAAEQIHNVSDQIVHMVRECFDKDVDGMAKFDQMLTDELRLPTIGSEFLGTKITADKDVISMDGSIPREPPIYGEQYHRNNRGT